MKTELEKIAGIKLKTNEGKLYYSDSLYLRGTQITALPNNLTVGGYLDLIGSQITALPDNLTVGGSLYLRGTQITALPNNLTVGGYLDLRGTQITALPENMTVGGYLISKLIGSRESITSYHIKYDVIHCGCFKGTISEFKTKVNSVYKSGIFREQYDEFIALAENWRSIYLSNKINN